MAFKKIFLPNRLRLVTIPLANTKAVTALVMVGAGSKYETKRTNGVAHFLEHMMFKGTRRRPSALAISGLLDGVGGEYNAFTGKEWTGYYVKVDNSHLELALDVLSDIYQRSLLLPEEIEKERGVIIEEINLYLDTPSRYIEDLWEKLLYGDQPAGWTIAGEKENIRRMRRKDFTDYLGAHYTAPATTVVVAGGFNEPGAQKLVRELFGGVAKRRAGKKLPVRERQREPRTLVFTKKTDQTHLAVGVRAYHLFSPKRWALAVLAAILGGGMSSRLFTEIREKRGLAYYVRTAAEHHTDSGYLATQAGVRLDAAEETIHIILDQYRAIARDGIMPEELKKAKEYLKGHLVLNLESSNEFAFYAGEQETLAHRIMTPEEKIRRLEGVSARQIQLVARDIFKNSKLNAALIGPFRKGDERRFKKLLSLS